MKNLFFVLVLAIGLASCTGGCKNQKIVSDPCPEKTAQILSLQAQVTKLQGEIATLKNDLLQAELDCLNSKVTITKTSGQSTSGQTNAGSGTKKTNTVKNATPPASGGGAAPTLKSATTPSGGGTVATPGRASNANLSGLMENGIISFCVMANGDRGLHFPQKALDKGVTFTSIETNPSNDGHNWIVEPVKFLEGDYGLTEDGTFFVSNEMMAKVLQSEGTQLQSCKIKAPFTKWQERDMYLRDGFWLYDALK